MQQQALYFSGRSDRICCFHRGSEESSVVTSSCFRWSDLLKNSTPASTMRSPKYGPFSEFAVSINFPASSIKTTDARPSLVPSLSNQVQIVDRTSLKDASPNTI